MAAENFKPLSDALASLNLSREQRVKAAVPSQSSDVKCQLSFELWPDKVRGVPNAALRGALFSVANERTISRKRELLSSIGGIEIRFKGERFNQTDLDTLEMLLHYGRKTPLETSVEFAGNKLLTDLGRGVGGEDHERLKEELARLMGGVVEITWTKDKRTFSGTLVKNAYRDEEKQQHVVIFDEKMLSLYDAGYTYIDWEQRRALGKNNLAKWLHGFYASHDTPFAYKVATLKSHCGSQTKRLGDFRKALRLALKALQNVGAICDWSVDEDSDLVTVTKKPLAKTLAAPKPVAA